jgi:hypothetical protein
MSMFDTSIILNQTISQMVGTYEDACECVRLSYAALEQAESNLESAFGKEYSDFSTLPERHYSNPSEEILNKIKCNAWRAIVNKLEVHKLMSVKRWDELNKKLQDPKNLPELTLPAIADIVNTFAQNANEFVEEAIREAFDYLRPREHYSGSRYKTNQKNAKFEIGKKIIMTRMVNNQYGGGFRVNYNEEQKLIALDKVFANLDGKTITDGYRSPIVDAINTNKSGVAETEYFKVKCYQNQNLHLEFKRLDLLKKFNAVAGGMNLKG